MAFVLLDLHTVEENQYDPGGCTPQQLEDRLINFGAAVCAAVRNTRRDVVGLQIVKQIVRSAMSPAANYAEARAAESRRGFVHKLQICLKELRETAFWLRLGERRNGRSGKLVELNEECDELTAIFVSSIKTAKKPRPQR